MRGISEESLKKLWDSFYVTEELVSDFEERMMRQCVEINDWKPIDENTPKNRQILLFYPEHKTPAGTLEPYIAAMPYNELAQIVFYVPTHWQELPPTPKEQP